MMKFVIPVLYFVLSSVSLQAQVQKEISFSKDIFPLLKAKCFKCHQQDNENPNNFSMDTYDLLMNSGTSARIIVPGNGDQSYIVKKIMPNPPKGAQMPMFSRKKLSQEEVDLLKQWIYQGAKKN